MLFILILNVYEIESGGGSDSGCKPTFPCKSCNDGPTTCTSCISGIGRVGTPSCTCSDGYY